MFNGVPFQVSGLQPLEERPRLLHRGRRGGPLRNAASLPEHEQPQGVEPLQGLRLQNRPRRLQPRFEPGQAEGHLPEQLRESQRTRSGHPADRHADGEHGHVLERRVVGAEVSEHDGAGESGDLSVGQRQYGLPGEQPERDVAVVQRRTVRTWPDPPLVNA